MERNEVFGKHILVVDDDPVARDSIALLLRIDRHVVTQAANGNEAIELVSRQNFDLAILDFAMPGMLGGELALNLKCIAPGLPIVMVSAHLEKLTDSDKPVDAVLAKPFATEELHKAVARLLYP